MASHRLKKLTLGDYELIGYSVGGEETVLAVPSLNVCFDVGKAPDQILAIDNLLLSHGHMDHAAGIAYYCSQRNFREIAPPRIFVHPKLAEPLEDLLDCWKRIDGARPPARIISMRDGDEYELRRNLFVSAFETNHMHNSLGFTIIERRQKLKKEYLDLPGHEIARLRRSGTDITYTLEIPLVTYLGDTMGGEFETNPNVLNSKILVTECTFLDPDHHDRARAGRHYHIEKLAQFLQTVNSEHIVIVHVTRRTDMELVQKSFEAMLPDDIHRRLRFLMEYKGRRNRPPRQQ